MSGQAGAVVVLRTTFGQMVSEDRGASFHWVCEEQIGYGGTQDPSIAITRDGSLLNAAYEGTSVSHDRGCSFPFADGLAGVYSVDLTVDRSDPSHALVVTAATSEQGIPSGALVESFDDGRSWTRRAALPEGFFPQNVDVAPSDSSRIYLTGPLLRPGATATVQTLLRSADGGTTYAERPVMVDGELETRSVYLSAVHPKLVNRLYVRAEGNADEPDRLLVSDDGGESFRVAIALTGGMLGFAISPDGARLAVGGPEAGVWIAASDAAPEGFTQRSAKPVTCLTWGEDGLFACGLDEASSGFALGRSTDEGATFEPLLLALGDVCGPRTDCPSGTAYPSVCPARWPAIRATLAVSGTPRAASCEGGPAGASASAGAGGRGGAGAVAEGGQAGTAGGALPTDRSGDDGCAAGVGTRNNERRDARVAALLVAVLGGARALRSRAKR